jgi:hypothetical protein
MGSPEEMVNMKRRETVRRELNGVVTTLNANHAVTSREFGVADNWSVVTIGCNTRARERGDIEVTGGPGVGHVRISCDGRLEMPIERWREFVAKVERHIRGE